MFAKRLSTPTLRHALNAASLSCMAVDPAVACSPLSWSGRHCSSVSVHVGSSVRPASMSAVNVEEFTLNEEVVTRDLANMAKWNALSEAIGTARATGDHTKLLGHVQAGLRMLEEIGATNAPIQCESLLCMEASQAYYKMGQYGEALRCAEQALESLRRDCKPELQDRAQIAEIEVFMGFILCKQGDYSLAIEAQELLQKVLHWVNVDAKSAMPMQAVAAVNLRRSVLTGLGLSTTVQATALASKGETSQAKELYAKGMDTLIEALNLHIDENDFELVKMTLKEILTSFEGLSDVSQAVTTCRKYISWCRRHDDANGVADGEAMLAALCARHAIESPLDAEKVKK